METIFSVVQVLKWDLFFYSHVYLLLYFIYWVVLEENNTLFKNFRLYGVYVAYAWLITIYVECIRMCLCENTW